MAPAAKATRNRPPLKRKPIFPKKFVRLNPSKLKKIWHRYDKLTPNMFILRGNYNQQCIKYSKQSRGRQHAASCLACIGFIQCCPPDKWTEYTIDRILDKGDKIYITSLNMKKTNCCCLTELYTTFYIGSLHIILEVDVPKPICGQVEADKDHPLSLYDALKEFFLSNTYCVLELGGRAITIFKYKGGYWFFDPEGRDDIGEITFVEKPMFAHCDIFNWPPNLACVMRFGGLKSLSDKLSPVRLSKNPFVLHPVIIKRKILENFDPPATMEEFSARLRFKELKKQMELFEDPKTAEPEVSPEWQRRPSTPANKDTSESQTNTKARKSKEEDEEVEVTKKPFEKPRVPSTTYFKDILRDKIGILRSIYHQNDKKFSKHPGKQSLPNAVTALAMLREYKSRNWIPKTVDEILINGEIYFMDCRKHMEKNANELKIRNLTDKLKINENVYKPKVDEKGIIGRLNSLTFQLLDLAEALDEFFVNHDTGIIIGPITVAVWKEQDRYYMFDPNERSKEGKAIEKPPKKDDSSDEDDEDEVNVQSEQGAACVTWFSDIKDLAKLYMENTPISKSKDYFVICNAEIQSYTDSVKAWNNWTVIDYGKWILRGTLHEGDRIFSKDSRDSQGTTIAIMALAYEQLNNPEQWTRKTIDEILEAGDTLHIESVSVLKAKDKLVSNKLFLSEVVNRFTVLERDINLFIEECAVNGVLNAPDSDATLNLRRGLEKFFKENNTGVIIAKGLSIAVWKDDDVYYYFDPHSRNDKGFFTLLGTACALRFLNLDDMCCVLLSNFEPDSNSTYNINSCIINVWEKTQSGISRPKLYDFAELDQNEAILRAELHEGDKDKFDIFADQQTIANLLVALGMPTIYPTQVWKQSTLNQILEIGQKLYEDSRKDLIKKAKNRKRGGGGGGGAGGADPESGAENMDEIPGEYGDFDEDEDIETITLDNVLKEYKIGANKITVTLDEGKTAKLENDLLLRGKEDRGTFYDTLQSVLTEFLDEEGEDIKQAIIKTDTYTIAVWRQDGVFYLFDPKGRDSKGMTMGRENWSNKVYPPESLGEQEGDKAEDYEDDPFNIEQGGGDTAVNPMTRFSVTKESDIQESSKISLEEVEEEAAEEEEEIYEPSVSAIEDHADADAKACVKQFTNVDSLVNHIIENIPPTKRDDDFTLVPIHIENKPQLKPKVDPDDPTAGYWKNFADIDKDQWILRGTNNMTDQIYPNYNRGHQHAAMGMAGLAFAELFDVSEFTPQTVNDMLKYGDRIHTIVVKTKLEDLNSLDDPSLTEAEKCLLLNKTKIEPADIMNNFLIGNWKITTEVTPKVVEGDIHAGDEGEILNLEKGLEKFFQNENYGILQAKQLAVGVFKGDGCYYMFDPESRGPNGTKEENGTACITRHTDLKSLAKLLLKNLEKDCSNDFCIDGVKFTTEKYERPAPKIEEVITINPKITAYNEVVPGKCILLGSFNMNHAKFAKPTNALAAPAALVALAMSKIQRTQNWTKPILDDIICHANKLYEHSKETLGYSFNPWEDTMFVELVKKDFNIGSIHVRCCICDDFKIGMIDIKHPTILNLRKGCEILFKTHNMGIIQTETQTTGIWSENGLFYMFDPYPRSDTGLMKYGGTSCLLVFKNVKFLTDHFIQNVPDKKKEGEFVIIPVHITAEEIKAKKRKPIYKCDILKCQDIPIFNCDEREDEFEKRKKAVAKAKADAPSDEDIKVCPDTCPEGPCIQNPEMCKEKFNMMLKKAWARYQSKQRTRKENEKIAKQMRRELYDFGNGLAILRAHYSQESHKYSKNSRGYQAIPNALVAIVMSKLHNPNTWSYKNIEIILDSADVLYKDSWWLYKPYNPFLGLKNVLRTFHIQSAKFTTYVYKPAILGDLAYRAMYVGLLNFFMHETCGIMITPYMQVALFQKAGQYFVFDPYSRDKYGVPVKCGTACLLRYDNIEDLTKKLLENAQCCKEQYCVCEEGKYSLHAVTMEMHKPDEPPSITLSSSTSTCRTEDIV